MENQVDAKPASNERINPWVYLKWWIIATVAINLILWIVAAFFPLLYGPVAFISILSIAYFALFAWRFEESIPADKIGIRTYFGKPTDIIDSGLPYAPRGIIDVQQVPISFTQTELPADPENIFRNEDVESVPEGKKTPLRISFNEGLKSVSAAKKIIGERDYIALDLKAISDEELKEFKALKPDVNIKKTRDNNWADWNPNDFDQLEDFMREKHKNSRALISFNHKVPEDGLNRRVTAEVVFILLWRVERDESIQFIRKLRTSENAIKQLEDEMGKVASRLMTKISIAQMLVNLDWFNAHLYMSILKKAHDWGARIDGAFVKKNNLNHDLNKAISELSKAEFTARADKEVTLLKGQADAEVIRLKEEARLSGKATGYKQMMTELDVEDARSVMSVDVANEMAKGGKAIIFGAEGITQAAVAATALLPEKKGGAEEKTKEG